MWIKGLTNWVRSLFPSSDFSRNVGLLAGSTALAQAIALLTSPILTRIYTPEDFGVLAVFTSFLTMLTVVATLRYDMAIPLPEHDDEAVCVLHLCFIIVICSVAMVGLGAWGTGYLATSWATVVSSALYVWLLLIAVFGAGVYQTFRYWAVRKGAFGAIARSTISQGLGRGVAQVGLGFLGIRPLGLLVGQVLGQILGGGSLALITWRGNHQSFIRPNVRGIIQAAKKYRRFPLFYSWASGLNAASLQVPVLIISQAFGDAVTGFFSLGYRLMQMPIVLIGQAVSQVFFGRAVRAYKEGKIAELTADVFRRLWLIGMPLALLLGIVAPELFALVFGNKWRQAGVYTQWQAPWLLFVFVASPLSALTAALEKQPHEALFQAILLVGRVGSLLIGVALGSSSIGIALFSGVGALCWLGYLVWLMRISGNQLRLLAAWMAREAIVVSLIFIPLFAAKTLAVEGIGANCVIPAAVLSASLAFARLAIIFRRKPEK